jgi:hypothetical protein
MYTPTALFSSQEPPAVTLSRFQGLLAKNNLDYGITWKWVGRCRHGIIEVYDIEMGPANGVVESEAFERNTQLWTESDTVLGQMHAGSPKHQAVKALAARLQVKSR